MCVTGQIKRLFTKSDPATGKSSMFGFVSGDDGRDYFFLPSSLDQTKPHRWPDLREGQKVEMDQIEARPKGVAANIVRVVG